MTAGKDVLVDRLTEDALGLLDAPGEWYYDPSNSTLYLWPNATAWRGSVDVTVLETLVSLNAVSTKVVECRGV